MKRINPYTRLLNEIKEYCSKVKYHHTKIMWSYPMEKAGSTWSLDDLYQRAAAANQLGYDVQVRADGKKLVVLYVKEVPANPYEWNY